MKMKTIVITGASSGLGKAIYDGYKGLNGDYGEFYNVIGISRRGPDIKCDLRIEIPNIKEDIDILINCAGILNIPESPDEIGNIFNINFVAPYQLIEKNLKANMLIVNIASISGMGPDPETPIYGASKAALLSLTASLAKKYAHRNIRENSISPGFYHTPLVPGEVPQEILDAVPLGANKGQFNDIFEIVRMMEQLEYMTGTNIVIDGGQLCKI